MKASKYLSILFCLIYFCSYSQKISIENKKFKVGNHVFFPMVVNYGVFIVKNTQTNNYFISPDHAYDQTGEYEFTTESGCFSQMQNHFNKIASMGFNALRIIGHTPAYRNQISEDKLVVDDMKQCTNIGGPDKAQGNDKIFDPSDDDDFLLQKILFYHEKILELANNAVNLNTNAPSPLKVIFLITGAESDYSETEVNLMEIYISKLAERLSQSNYREALLAYDLMNEPAFHIEPKKTKQEACELVARWYDAVKAQDPTALVTIGTCGFEDIFSFDPSLMKVDFLSLHGYNNHYLKQEGIDKTNSQHQERANTFLLNHLHWLNENVNIPWIIGETGFAAKDPTLIDDRMMGTLSDMENFAAFTLQQTCNCGGAGYSWWLYQDVTHGGNTPDNLDYYQNFWGLLKQSMAYNDPNAEKSLVEFFRNFVPSVTGPCAVSKSDVYNENDVYYKPFPFPPNINQTIGAHVVDQNGEPVKNAVIKVTIGKGFLLESPQIENSGNPQHQTFYSFTDINGKFEIRPFNNLFHATDYTNRNSGIFWVDISAAGHDRVSFSFINFNSSGIPNLGIPSTIVLKRATSKVEKIYSNIEIFDDLPVDENEALRNLIFNNVQIYIGTVAEFKAGNQISLKPGTHVYSGTNVSFSIADIIPSCDELSDLVMPPLNRIMSKEREMKLEVHEPIGFRNLLNPYRITNYSKDNQLFVFPNPFENRLELKLESNTGEIIKNLIIYSSSGRTIYEQYASQHAISINLPNLAKGLYLLKIIDGNGRFYTHKLIKQ